jgi:UDP-N-acetylmuramyl pentapeptide phosphotransferase/UDP-N-acetylglucosamine-1-phosphate transferase
VNPSLLAVTSVLVFFASYTIVRLLIQWALRNQVLDIPNERSSHSDPTPRGGGLAIVLASLVAWLIYLRLVHADPRIVAVLAYSVGAVVIAFTSWQDDLQPLPTWLRFGVHAGAALLVLIAIGYWRNLALPIVGTFEIGWLGIPLTFLWIVGLTNAYNFMDGIDGLAGGQAAIAALGWALLAWHYGQPLVVAFALFLAAAAIGFLSFNWPPARIFMGDVGSAFLGYTFAVLPLLVSSVESSLPVVAVVLVWPFVFDTSFTLMRRLRNREKIFAAHRSHLYQRLVISGLSHQAVTLLYLSLALINSVLALSWILFASVAAAQAALVTFLLLQSFLLWRFVVRRERPAVQSRI